MHVRRLLRWFIWGVLGIVVLLAFGALLIQTSWGHERIRRILISQSARLLAGKLEVRSLSGSLFTDTTLHGVTLIQDGQPLLQADEIRVSYTIRGFTQGAIDIREVSMRNPRIAIVETANGWNVGKILAKQADGKPGRARPVSIGRLLIADGELHVAPRGQPARDLSAVQFDGDVSYKESRLTLNTTRLAAVDPATGLDLREFTAAIVMDRDQIIVDRLDVHTAASHLSGHVRVRERSTLANLDAELTADPVSFPEISRYVKALAAIKLTPQIKLNARGPLNRLDATWDVRSTSGSVAGRGIFDVSKAVRTVRGDVNVTSLNLAHFTGRPGLNSRLTGKVNIAATIPPEGWSRTRFEFRTDARDVMFQTYRAQAIHASGVYDVATGVTARGNGVAYGVAGTFDLKWQSRSGLFVSSGHAEHVDLRQLADTFGAPRLDTNLAADYRVAVDAHGWGADATLADSTVEGARLVNGSTGHIESRAGLLTYATEGHVSALDLNRLLYALRQSPPDPRLAGLIDSGFRLEGRGTIEALAEHDASASISMINSKVGGVEIEALNVSATLTERELTADISGRAQGEPPMVGETLPDTRVNGVVNAHVVWHDITAPITPTSMDGTVKLDVTESRVNGLAVDRMAIDATVEDGLARVALGEFEGPAFKGYAAGTVALGARGESDLNYSVDVLDLGTLGALAKQTIAGGAHLEGRIQGTHALTNVAGSLAAHELKRETVTALTINGKYELEIPDLEVRRARGSSEIDATFAEVGAFKIQQMSVKLQYDANNIDVITSVEQKDRTFTAEAGLLLEPDRRVLRLRQFAMDAGGTVWQLSGGDATVHHGTELKISDLTLTSKNAARITVEGAIPFKADAGAPGTLTATLSGVPMEDFDKILLGTQRVKGRLDGTMNVSGSFEKPHATTDLRVTNGVAGNVSYQQLTVKAEYLDRIARLDARLQVDASTGLTVGGTIPLDGEGLDVRAQTEGLDAALLEPLLVGRLDQLGGILKMDIQVGGALRQPNVRGDVGFVNGQFRFIPTGAGFRRLNAGVRFEGDRVDVDQFSVEDSDGHRLTVTGTSSGAGLGRKLDITAKSSGLHVLHNELGELALDTDLKATGTLQAPDVQGVLRIARGRLEVDKLLKRFSSSAYEPVAPAQPGEEKKAAEPEQPGLFSQATVDVRIDVPDNLVLRGRDLRVSARSAGLGDINMTTGGTIRAQKEAGASTTLLGQISIVRGQYNFQGRRFDIERGSDVRWLGQGTLDPVIAVTATRDISGVVAKVSITGTVTRPEIALSSDPPLDPGDVLSLIVFNQPINELGEGEQVSLAERAGLLAAGALATPISDSVARALDLDVFEIRTGEAAGAGPTITVGRQVSEQLFVGFRHEFGDQDISRVSFEYRFRKFMRVVTTWGQGTNPNRVPREETAGIDLFFVIKR